MEKRKRWFIYVIKAQSGALYTGITTDLKRRLSEHKNSSKGAKFFRLSAPKKVLYQETCWSRSKASRREAAIKKLSRAAKLKLLGIQ